MTVTDNDDPAVGETLRDLIDRRRGDLGLNIKQVAARANIPDRTIRSWRGGENTPGPAMLAALGRALGGRIAALPDGTYRFQSSPATDGVDHIQVGDGEESSFSFSISVDREAWRGMSEIDRELAIARAKAVILEVMRESERESARRPQDP